ncbi:ATP-binding protein [Streptomyces sp. NPDC087226]|jgi:signal transduction histidine kinase|uniref:ATP-binding protein n=1 Tax=Streptomyces sp. NPDC087226 TaxID=3365771 RepID=UPI00380F20A4
MTVMATPHPTGSPGYSETLPRKPESAAVARTLVRTALAAWGLEEHIDDAMVVITELVSNAVEHGRLASIRVVVTRPAEHWVRLGVVDPPGPSLCCGPTPTETRSAAVASSWSTP